VIRVSVTVVPFETGTEELVIGDTGVVAVVAEETVVFW
jgi:hypothetical protein